MQDKLKTWYSELNDRLPTTRRLEATAHVASWLAVSLTALMVGTAQAAEANPVSAFLIEMLGMGGFGVLAAVLVSALYRLIHRYGNHKFAVLPATALTLDVIGNTWVISQAGLPDSAYWGELALTSILVAATAFACYYRVPFSLPRTENKAKVTRVAVIAGLVLLSSMSGPISSSGPIGAVEAADGAWSDIPDMPNSPDREFTTATSVDGLAYFHNNYDSGAQQLQIYNPDTNTWSKSAYPNSAHQRAAVEGLNGYVYLAGAVPGGSQVERYDPDTDSWEPVAPMNTGREQHQLVSADGKLYAIGGEGSGGSELTSVEVYDAGTDSWSYVASHPKEIDQFAAEAYNGNIYTFGNGDSETSEVYKYDISQDSWSNVGSVPDGNHHLGASPGPNGVDGILITGGSVGIDPMYDTAHIFYPSNNSFVQIESLNEKRHAHGQATIGQTVVIGGGIGPAPDYNYLQTAESYSFPEISTPTSSTDIEVTVDDQTENNQFENPRSVTFASEKGIQEARFNTYDKAFLSLEPDQYYDWTVRSESNAVWEVRYRPKAKYLPNNLTLRPGGATGDVTVNGTKVLFNAVDNTNTSLPNATSVAMNTDDPVTEFNFTIEDERGNPIYNGSREFDEPTSYYEAQIGANQTNGTTVDDDASVSYGGTYENGTTFSGNADYSGEIEGGIIGPVGGSGGGGGGGSPIVGVALVGGVGYLAYRQFGSGQLGNAVSSAVGRLRP